MSAELLTPRLLLRRWQERDHASFAAMNADPAVMTYFPAPMTRDESDAAIARYTAAFESTGFSFFVAELRETGDFVGLIGLQIMRDVIPHVPQPVVEIGWRLRREFQGQGLATEGARAIIDYAFNTLALTDVIAITALGNAASRNVMQKLGMTYRPELDFDHPRMSAGHPHQRHALYSLTNPGTI